MNIQTLLILIIALLVAGFAGLFIIWHKIRRVHLMTYGIREQAVAANRESSALFGQLRAAAYLDGILGLPGPPLPMRRAAASPDFLLLIADEISKCKPSVVLDLGSGSSTVVAARCLQQSGHGHVFSLDHDPRYAELTRQLLSVYGLTQWATVVDAPLVPSQWGEHWYSLANLPAAAQHAELLLVDGPPAWQIPLARYPALPMLAERLAPGCVILVDDANRKGERRMLERWKSEFPAFTQEHHPCEKGAVVLRRKSSIASQPSDVH